ncbi:hypothetical protein MNBD_GAMMA11-1310 [hydrothermal vent metagenome]|uniref:General secretion pathway GspH domain-containing protein n=1 Tax=hydrothermal vent metagenome TaxID=652676 RepID=A0A3B0WSL6_9ZZZZ
MELMVVVAMASMLAAIGMPSFNAMIITNELADTSNDLTLSLKRARAEAITSGRDVRVCSSLTTQSSDAGNAICSLAAGNWGKGWLILVDRNQDGNFKESDNELLWVKRIDAGRGITINPVPPVGLTTNNFESAVTFSYTGEIKKSANGGFQLCSGIEGGFPRREITVSVSGQTHFEKNTNSAVDC